MADETADRRILRAPLADLERALIDTFLHARGYDTGTLAALPAPERDALLREASLHASTKLAEIEARSHYLDELHE